jgi:competence protein ComEC
MTEPQMSCEKPTRTAAVTQIDHPSVWLIVPTLSLLIGQAGAGLPIVIPSQVFFLTLIPLLLVIKKTTRRWGLLIFTAGLSFSLGYIRHWQLLHPHFPPNHVHSLAGDNARIYLEGILAREPERLPNRNRWLLRCERIWHPTGAEDISGNLLLSVRRVGREWHYDDRVRFWIRPQEPRDTGNPGGFDYATYLARQEIYAIAYLEDDREVELVTRSPGQVSGAIESLRREIRRFIDQHVSSDNGALMKALVVGDMGTITKDIRNEFTAAGVNHVLSISGLHVSMLGLVVFWLVRFAGSYSTYLLLRWNLLKVGTFLSFLAVAFYTVIAGAMVPTVRSAIMIGVYELAVLLDREEEVFASLTFAALLIALIWPAVIADISFQLSFLAVLFIVWGMRRMIDRSPRRPSDELPQERSWWKQKLRQGRLHLAVPLFATLGTGPLIAHYFGHLSLAGFVSNPIIVPLVGFVIVPLGLLTGFLSLILPSGAGVLVWPAEYLSSLTLWLVRLFAHLPLANIAVPVPNLLEVTALYLFIVSIFLLRRNRLAICAVGLFAFLLAADAAYWWRERWERKDLRVTHLNVGQGDAAVVELPGSKVLVVDAGGTALGDFDTGEGIVGPYLRSRKILKVDYLFLSHPRVDHYGGMRSIVMEFAPVEFWSGPSRGKTTRFDDLEEALEQARIKRVTLSDQDPCRAIDGVKFCVLYPPPDGLDDTSVVLRLEFGKIRILFAGDLDKRDEQRLQLKAEQLRSAVLKVPRHGSAGSSTQEFVTAVRPSLAIFSLGARNAFGLSRDEVVARYRQAGAEILRTDEDGAIILETDGATIRYSGHKSGKNGTLSF